MSKKKYRSPESLAKLLVRKKTRHGVSKAAAKEGDINCFRSIATENKAASCTKIFFEYRQSQHLPFARISASDIHQFLLNHATKHKQKTLDGYRQTLAIVFNVKDIPYVKSQVPTILLSRAYSDEQITYLSENGSPAISLSIRLAAAAGLRAEEVDTIARRSELQESDRGWRVDRFVGRDDHILYVVEGKGGLKRKISVPSEIAIELEMLRLPEPVRIRQRGIFYQKRYDIPGGQSFSKKFSLLSDKCFTWSVGAHGLRHRYVQNRMAFLQKLGYSWNDALQIVSEEIGHFSTQNTLTYMR